MGARLQAAWHAFGSAFGRGIGNDPFPTELPSIDPKRKTSRPLDQIVKGFAFVDFTKIVREFVEVDFGLPSFLWK